MSADKLTKAEQRQLAEGVRRIAIEREAFAASMQDLAKHHANQETADSEYLAVIDKLRSEAATMRELARRIRVGEWQQGAPAVRYIDRPNEYDPPTEIEIAEFDRRNYNERMRQAAIDEGKLGFTSKHRCPCDFCQGRKDWNDNWCSRCGNVQMVAPKWWENEDVCDKCEAIDDTDVPSDHQQQLLHEEFGK